MKKEDFIFGLYFGLAIYLIIVFGLGALWKITNKKCEVV